MVKFGPVYLCCPASIMAVYRARQVANSIAIDKHIYSPQNLFWLLRQKNKNKQIHPVRIPPDDSEYIGYKSVLHVKDPSRQCVVQYLQFPHVEITSNNYIGKYNVVARSRLIPYHGGREKKDANITPGDERKEGDDHDTHSRRQWCPILSKAYLKQLKQQYKKMGDIAIRTEELYLERVLKRAFQEMERRQSLHQYDQMAAEEPQKCDATSATEEKTKSDKDNDDNNNNNHDSDRETNRGRRRSKRTHNQLDDTTTEWLHCGDVIRFYKPGFAAGDARFLCEATITSIRPRDDPSLVVDCDGEWYLVIPNDHPVMRIKRMERGELVENVGCCYRPVENYTLKREGGNHTVKEVIEKRVQKVKEITERNKRLAIENIERDGCGPTDMFR
eukprot:CCRYP_003181-RA/>CCRYP_003181-RA protein AED:0.38 eAED:0.41 QI:0/0/0.5/1/1/1/2/209/387